MVVRKLASLAIFQAHSAKVNALSFSNDSKLLATASEDRTVKIWHFNKQNQVVSRVVFESLIATSLAFSRDNQILITGEEDNVKLRCLKSRKTLKSLVGHQKKVNAVAVHPRNKLIATASEDNRVILWSLRSGEMVCTFTEHQDSVTDLAFSPDGKILASSGDANDKTVKLWFLSNNKLITLKGHSDWFGGVNSVAFSPDSKVIVSGSKDKTIKIWRVETGEEIMTLRSHQDDITSVTVSLDGILATSSKDKTTKFWQLATGKLISTMKHQEAVQNIKYMPRDSVLAMGCHDGKIKLRSQSLTSSRQLQDLL